MMSYIKKVQGKPRLHVSVLFAVLCIIMFKCLCQLIIWRMVAILRDSTAVAAVVRTRPRATRLNNVCVKLSRRERLRAA